MLTWLWSHSLMCVVICVAVVSACCRRRIKAIVLHLRLLRFLVRLHCSSSNSKLGYSPWPSTPLALRNSHHHRCVDFIPNPRKYLISLYDDEGVNTITSQKTSFSTQYSECIRKTLSCMVPFGIFKAFIACTDIIQLGYRDSFTGSVQTPCLITFAAEIGDRGK